jgi:hypothetical protein
MNAACLCTGAGGSAWNTPLDSHSLSPAAPADTGLMFGMPQPHIAFRRMAQYPVPLGRIELEPVLPPGWWGGATWQLPQAVPAMQAEMLLQLLADKADYEERKKRGFAAELEGQLESLQAGGSRPATPPLPAGIPLPVPAKAALVPAEDATPIEKAKTAAVLATAAVPATIAAAAFGAEKLKLEQNGPAVSPASGTASSASEAPAERSGSAKSGQTAADVKVSPPGAPSRETEQAQPASASGSDRGPEERPASSSGAAKPEATGRLKPPPSPALFSSSGGSATSKGPAPEPPSPSTPLSPEPSPSPLNREARNGTGGSVAVPDILAEISAAASGWEGPSTASVTTEFAQSATPPEGDRIPTPREREGGAAQRSESVGQSAAGAPAAEGPGPSAVEAAPNMQSILDMLLPKVSGRFC